MLSSDDRAEAAQNLAMRSPIANSTQTYAVPFDGIMHLVAKERRRNTRVPLHWAAYLVRAGSADRIQTTTRNINSDGFYCLLDQPLLLGERIDCVIVVPTHGSYPDDVVYLRCVARVVRAEKIELGPKFGLACEIEDYCMTLESRPPE
jgi:hypothetical protein